MSHTISTQLDKLIEWSIVGDKIHRDFEFVDFNQAMDFMSQVAKACESLNHHPNWCNNYQRVRIDLTTHSQGAITQLDIDLANKIDQIYTKFI